MGEQHPHARPAAERRRAGQALEDDAAERVDVRGRADVLAPDLLGGHVVQRSERLPGPREVGGLAVLGQPEVGHVRGVAVEEDVGGLDVAVHEPGVVQRVDSPGGRRQHADHLLEAQRPARQQAVGQRPARDEALDQVRQAVLLAVGEHRHHVRVVDLLGRLDLAAEAAQEHVILRELGRDDLQGDGLAAVLGPLEDDPHAAAPDDPGDPVGTEGITRPGLQRDLRHASGERISPRLGNPSTHPVLPLGDTCASPSERRHSFVISLMDRPMLGDYRIEGIVGVGRTGIVYLATDSRTGRAVALKVLREDVSIDPIYRERFRREGALLAALRPPHVIPISGMGEIDGDLYIATRLVSGTLKNVILAGQIPLEVAVRIITAVAEAVDAAHVAGIVHRDVKPANVLLDPGPVVYLGDFGLARAPDGPALTMPGQVIGTLDYMAPEHLEAEGVGPPADIYALTCLMYETLSGEVPFIRATDAAVMYAHVVEDPPRISDKRADVPAALDDVIAAGMAKDPDDRPPTARALLTEMLRALGRPVPARMVATG